MNGPDIEATSARRRPIVLLAWYFPPDGGAGSQRPRGFARHLPALGFDVTVVTRPAPTARGDWDPADTSLGGAIDRSVRVVRAPFDGEPPRGLHRDALSATERALRETIESIRVEREQEPVVLVTMSPFEFAEIGLRVQRDLGVRVVFDLRDPWALDGWPTYRHRWQWAHDRDRMATTLRDAAGVVANTPEASRVFRDLVPDLDDARLTVVPNGFEAEDFQPPFTPIPARETLTIVHTGSFHSRGLPGTTTWKQRINSLWRHSPEPIVRSGRSPLHLLEAFRRLRERGHEAGSVLRARFLGVADDATHALVARSGVADAVEVEGYRPHAESVDVIRAADALFLPLGGLPVGYRSRIVPGKTYEYLATGRPIVAALPEGDALELVQRGGRAYACDPVNADSIADALVRLHADWVGGATAVTEPPTWIGEFERGALTVRLGAFLDQVAALPIRTDTR